MYTHTHKKYIHFIIGMSGEEGGRVKKVKYIEKALSCARATKCILAASQSKSPGLRVTPSRIIMLSTYANRHLMSNYNFKFLF